jgi:hypothetical protein
MKNLMILFALIFCLATVTQAQLPHLSIYGHALYASSIDKNSQQLYNGGAGGVAGILIGSNNTRFNGSIGYTDFFADNSNTAGSLSYVPVKAGFRQYIPLTLHFLYAQADAGVGFLNDQHGDGNSSAFAFDFGAGVKLGVFEGGLVWDFFDSKHGSGLSSWITIQAGFNIGF